MNHHKHTKIFLRWLLHTPSISGCQAKEIDHIWRAIPQFSPFNLGKYTFVNLPENEELVEYQKSEVLAC
jgi:hypothetical protein